MEEWDTKEIDEVTQRPKTDKNEVNEWKTSFEDIICW